jgi:hypothetical protein
MSVLIELSEDEVRVLSTIMAKVGIPMIPTFSIQNTPKKLSKTEIARQSITEARARKEARRKRNN